jgi:RimJ/RimL family protein N-acetyltransferase
MTMNDLKYSPGEMMAIHIETLFTQDANLRLVGVNEPWPGFRPAPRFFLGCAQDGTVISRYRRDMPAALIMTLQKLVEATTTNGYMGREPEHVRAFLELLDAAPSAVYTGPAFRVPEMPDPVSEVVRITTGNVHLIPDEFGWLIQELTYAQPCVGLITDNRIVAICRSVRIGARAHEAGLETLDEYRGKGYALQVLAAWSKLVRHEGGMPMYSTSWDNEASLRVAKKSALICYGTGFSVV